MREELAERLRVQAMHCITNGSPLYEGLLLRAAADVETGGPVWHVFEGRGAAPPPSPGPPGLVGAGPRVGPEGRAEPLARLLPSVAIAEGGEPSPVDVAAAWAAFLEVVDSMRDEVAELLDHPIQTNEVGRSAPLLGGFLEVAKLGLPLRLAEIGASAGLNLRWDRYRYEQDDAAWGDAGSPVRFVSPFREDGALPALDVDVEIAERTGCDRAPVDPTSEDGRLTLMSYVWADQVERFTRLRGALEVARRVPADLERADAFEWLEHRLPDRRPGTAAVVFQSIVALYFTPEQRERMASMLADAGST